MDVISSREKKIVWLDGELKVHLITGTYLTMHVALVDRGTILPRMPFTPEDWDVVVGLNLRSCTCVLEVQSK